MKQKKEGKKKFIGFYLRRLLLIVLALAVAGTLQIYQYLKDYEDSLHADSSDYPAYPIELLTNLLSDAVEREDGAVVDLEKQAAYYLANNADYYGFNRVPDMEAYWMLFEPETGKYYLSEPYIIAYTWRGSEEDSEMHTYIMDDPEIAAEYRSHIDNYLDIEPIVQSIYVKDDKFRLGEVYYPEQSLIRSIFKEDLPYDYHIRGEWKDYTPADLDGWKKIESPYTKEENEYYNHSNYDVERADSIRYSNEGYLSFVKVHGTTNAVHLKPLMDEMLKELQDTTVQMNDRLKKLKDISGEPFTPDIADEWNVDSKEELLEQVNEKINGINNGWQSRLKLVMCRVMEEQLGEMLYNDYDEAMHYSMDANAVSIPINGKTWYLCHFEYCNVWTLGGTYILVYFINFGIMALFGAIISALIWALIRYHFYSKRYDIDAYRRNMAGALAHDLKTPMTAISGYAENLLEHTHPEKADSYAKSILDSIQHMDETIGSTLGLAKLEQIRRPEKQQVDLIAIVQQEIEKVNDETLVQGLRWNVSGSCVVMGNEAMVRQMAANLVVNACQHAAKNSEITVYGHKKRFSMNNHFVGELDEKTLCEPFRRGDEARSRRSGSGMGLSIVKQIAALHKWRFKVTARDGVFTATLNCTFNPLLLLHF